MNETMNTKVQRCRVTPSQPSEVWWWWWRYEWKAGGKGRKEWMKRWELQQTRHAADIRKFELSTARDCWIFFLSSFSLIVILPHRHPSPSSSFPHRHLPSLIVVFLPSSSSSFPVWVDLVSPSTLNFGVQRVLFTDSGVSNMCDLSSTCNPWSRAKDNTLRGIFVPLPELKSYRLRIHLAIVTVS